MSNGYVYIGSGWHDGWLSSVAYTGRLYCLDAETGAKVWEFNPGGDDTAIWSSPSVCEGYVYVGSCNPVSKVFRLNALTGEKDWGKKSIPTPNGGSHTVEMHKLLDRHGVRHVYNSSLKVPHRWDKQWMRPTLEALMALARETKVSTPLTLPPKS